MQHSFSRGGGGRHSLNFITRGILAFALLGSVFLCAEPSSVHAAGAPCSITPVLTEANLNTCIAEAPTDNSEFTITLGADFNITAAKNIVAGKNITLTSTNPANPTTLTRNTGFAGRFFSIDINAPGVATLTLDSVILDGGSQPAAINSQLIHAYGTGDTTINLSGNTILRNNNNAYPGAVYISGSNQKLNLSGNAQIINNTAGTYGGGVRVEGGCTLTMSGNAIISGNAAGNDGGGVSISAYSTFIMTGGTISNNTASLNGGGVSVAGIGNTTTITGGQIVNNTASFDGGAIGIAYENLSSLTVGPGVVFAGNSAAIATRMRPVDQALYDTQISATSFSLPIPFNGYNNYDISYASYLSTNVCQHNTSLWADDVKCIAAPGTGLFGGQISGAIASALSIVLSGIAIVAIFAIRKLITKHKKTTPAPST